MNKRNKKKMLKTANRLGIRFSTGVAYIMFDHHHLTTEHVKLILRAIASQRMKAIELRTLNYRFKGL